MPRRIRTAAIGLCVLLALPVAALAQNETRRDDWQRVADIVAALGATAGGHVADVGAGDGYFTTRLSKAVTDAGVVYAVDISTQSLARLRARLDSDGIRNVQVVEGAPNDPRLPEARLDAALIVNAYHEMTEHQAMLAAIRRALKPQGRLVIIEPISEQRRGATRDVQERSHEIAPEYVQADLAAAGFRVLRFEDGFAQRPAGDSEWMIVATPAPAPSSAPAPAAQPENTDWLSPAIRIDLAEARKLFDTDAAIFVDVRGIEMYGKGHIEGAQVTDLRGLKAIAPALSGAGKRIITYCS